MTAIRAVGFDLGETLLFYRDAPLNWASLYPSALSAVAGACRMTPSAAQFEAAREILIRHNTRIVPRTREVPAETVMSLILRSWDLDPSAYCDRAIESFFTFFQQQLCCYPDSVPTLTLLRERGFKTGILTDVPYGMPRAFVQRDLERTGISTLIDTVLTSVESGVRKPETGGYLALAERLGVQPHEMLYVGNEPKDVIGANHAGLHSVLLDREGTGGQHGQHFTLSTLSGLDRLLWTGVK